MFLKNVLRGEFSIPEFQFWIFTSRNRSLFKDMDANVNITHTLGEPNFMKLCLGWYLQYVYNILNHWYILLLART